MSLILKQIYYLGVLNKLAAKISVFLASCFIGLMTVIVIAGVFFRYVLNDSLPWVEDVSLILMVTTAFIIAPFAYRSGANVAIEIIVDMLPRSGVRIIRLIVNMMVMWLLYRYFFESLSLVDRGWGIRINSVPLPWAIPYLIVPVAFFEMGLVAVELVGRDVWGLVFRSGKADLPHHAYLREDV